MTSGKARGRNAKWGSVGLGAFPSLLSLALLWLGVFHFGVEPAFGRLAPPGYARKFLDQVEILHLVARGETLGTILTGLGVSYGEVEELAASAKPHYDLKRILPGRRMRLFFDGSGSRLIGLEYEITVNEVLSLEKSKGRIRAQKRSVQTGVSPRSVTATVSSNIYDAAAAVGVPDRIIAELADLFAWEIDFSSDIQPGDSFSIVYEEVSTGGGTPQAGRILAAEVESGGTSFSAFFYDKGEGRGGYYDLSGRPLGRPFLRSPLAFTRVSSPFARARMHPVLKRRRPHLGVDLAAPVGTPVRAVADGEVTSLGWEGGYGRTVRVTHGRDCETLYAHFMRFAPGLKPGKRVRRGQVVGYVGRSGLTTGPHLHFAMFRDGVYVNPLQTHMPVGDPLDDRELVRFLRASMSLRVRLAQLAKNREQPQFSFTQPAGSLLLNPPPSPLASQLF